ncbi:MAG: PIN domain-containing protein [Nanoarchaeota archaeon]|nr:PIN domain-containing protein [Nanoarchaeota archaeon]MBU4492814.1 PIN domain-containing protein [Nanoarchaeota archaeon]
MAKKYYIDTSIWIDLYENRKGYNDEPLGDFALKLFSLIKAKKNKLIITDILIRELEMSYSLEEINGMVKPFEKIIEKVIATTEQRDESKKIAEERSLPPGDVLHAIIARDHNLILITRDKHFRRLEDISKNYKPEDII